MKKLLGLFVFLLVCVLTAPTVYAYPSLQVGENEFYYTNRETVFRLGDATLGQETDEYYELDYSDSTNLPVLMAGDIFIGTVKVQEIVSENGSWYQSGTDQLLGIFAQEITSIEDIGPVNGLTLKVNLNAATSASGATFNALDTSTFTTGLTDNEIMKWYAHNANNWQDNGTIGQDYTDIINLGTDWATFEMDPNANDYAYTLITPQGTALDDFVGKSYIGFSITDFYNPSILGPGVIDPEVGLLVDFYANSELEGHDDYIKATGSPWVFESNDPAYMNGAIPEPNTMILFGTALLGASAMMRRRKE